MPAENHLLAALSEEVRSRLFGQLELVALALGNVLYESGDTLRHVYFPTDSIIIPALRDEARCVGGDLCSRQQRADRRCIVHGRRKHPKSRDGAERSFRLPTRRTAAQRRVQPPRRTAGADAAYPQSLLTQTVQTAVCNRHHTIDQSLCR